MIYSYPKTVYISNDLHELGWNIKCLKMKHDEDNECANTNKIPFWIEQKYQEIIGWFMLGLVLLMSCIGHFIAYLKKRARRKHRIRVRNQRIGHDQQQQAKSGGLSRSNSNANMRNRSRQKQKRGAPRNRNQIIEEEIDNN